MTSHYTEDLSEFGYREISLLCELLNAWVTNGLPEHFGTGGVKPALNKMSGYVFLTNEDYEVAMLNGNTLEAFYSLPYSGEEGFLADLISEYHPGDLHGVDVAYILDLAEAAALDLPEAWLTLHVDRILADES
jgi:hypothetical protein